jgi:parvulin-like peptidyl-prolyl isomerase
MLQALRDNMKYILGVVAVAFIIMLVFSWGMGGFKDKTEAERGIIGIINGHKVYYQQFRTLVNQQLEGLREQTGSQEINEYQIQNIRQQVWQGLVQEILVQQEIQRLNIQATPEEVVFQLRNNPTEEIQQIEQFQTDGQFDISKYHQALSDPRNYNVWIPIENQLKQLIPMQKLTNQILSTVRVTDQEAFEDFRWDNEKVNAKYVFFNIVNVSLENIEVTEDEIKSYYKENNENYQEPEKRKIQYVLFKANPSQEDTLQTLYDIEDILEDIKQGADFETTASEVSEDEGTKEKGGDLGFFGRGSMVKPFEDAAFAAKPGDIVGPVETPFGFHLIQVLAKKKENGEEKVHARHILLRIKTSVETYDDIRNRADYFYDETIREKGKNFEELAQQEGIDVMETPYFQEGGFIPGIGIVGPINHYVFKEKVGWISQPLYNGDDLMIFRVADIKKAHTKSLEEITETIQATLTNEKKKEKSDALCREARGKLETMTFDEVAEEYGLTTETTGLFARNTSIPKIGRNPKLIGAAFSLERGDISDPIEGDRGYYIIQILSHTDVDSKAFEAEKESRKRMLLQEKQQQAVTAWYNNLKDKAEIEDYREQYF